MANGLSKRLFYDQENVCYSPWRLDKQRLLDVHGDPSEDHVVEGGVGSGVDAVPERDPGRPAVNPRAPNATGWTGCATGIYSLARRVGFVYLCGHRRASHIDHGA